MQSVRPRMMGGLFAVFVLMSFLGHSTQEIFQPPFVTEPDRVNDIYFKGNDNVTLKCVAEGIPSPTYEWRFNGKTIKDNEYIKGDPKTGLLRIILASRREQGVYVCRASNTMGGTEAVSVSNPQTLKMVYVETFKDNDVVHKVKATRYGSVSLKCLGQGDIVAPKEDVTRSWYVKQSSVQLNSDNGRRYVDSEGTLHLIYVKASDQLSDDQTYACALASSRDSEIKLGSFTLLTVQESTPTAIKPTLLFKNSGLQASLATTANLECVFAGYDPTSADNLPTITWYDDANMEIKSDGKKYTLKKRNSVLSIADIEEDDDREFLCQANNIAGYSQKQTVSLNVTSAPIWVTAPSSVIVTTQSNAVIHCSTRSVSGEREPNTPVWSINGLEFDEARRENMVLSQDKKTLTIKDVKKPDDIMCVQCSVSNSVGQTIGGACVNVILPIEIKLECEKCKDMSPDECNCAKWDLGRGDALSVHLTFKTDPAYQDKVNREWIFHDTVYRHPDLPPHMTRGRQREDYILNTSSLSEETFSTLGGDYVYRIAHTADSQNVTITVVLKGIAPEPSTSSARIDMWIIGLIIGIVFLLVIFIVFIVVLCRKKQEGVYNLGKKETTAGLNPEKDLENRTFSDLSRPEYEEDGEYHDDEMRHDAEDITRDRLLQRNGHGGSVSEV